MQTQSKVNDLLKLLGSPNYTSKHAFMILVNYFDLPIHIGVERGREHDFDKCTQNLFKKWLRNLESLSFIIV